MFDVPRTLPTISRRRALFSAAALALLGATAACGTAPPPPEYTELTAALEAARADAALATAVAATLSPAAAPQRALTQVAAERTAHAKALTDELTRIAGKHADAWASGTSTAGPSSPAPTASSVDDVVAALQLSAQRATELVTSLDGYRAGLLGSIAAACTAAHSVALGGAR